MRDSSDHLADEKPRRRFRIPALFWLVIAAVLLSGIGVGLTFWIPRLQHQRLVARVEKLGGVVYSESAPTADLSSWFSGRRRRVLAVDLSAAELNDDDLEALTEFTEIRRLLIAGHNLTDAGFEHLKNLEYLESLVLVDCPRISQQGEATLMSQNPVLEITHRGPALLGIIGPRHSSRGCLIQTVRPGSAAATAGLSRWDLITQFDGKVVTDFKGLTRLIAKHQPGDRVEIVAYRRGSRLNFTVELGTWKAMASRN